MFPAGPSTTRASLPLLVLQISFGFGVVIIVTLVPVNAALEWFANRRQLCPRVLFICQNISITEYYFIPNSGPTHTFFQLYDPVIL